MQVTRLIGSLSLAATVSLAACSGGGGSANAGGSSTVPSAPATAQKSSMTIKLVIPSNSATASAIAHRAYVSAAAQSVVFTLKNYDNQVVATTDSLGTPTVFPLNSTYCTTSATPITCTFTAQEPIGTDVFQIATYASTNGTGTPLSINPSAPPLTVSAAGPNTFDVTLGGVVASLLFSPATGTVGDGVQSLVNTGTTAAPVTTVALNALDASGDTIVGAGSYSKADGSPDNITIACSAHFTAENAANAQVGTATAPITAPGMLAQIAYDGTSLGTSFPQTATCTATDSNTTANSATFTITDSVATSSTNVTLH